jgi:predicted nucleotide-binding protein (sugar kinase/HSP70/actin superfamily)
LPPQCGHGKSPFRIAFCISTSLSFDNRLKNRLISDDYSLFTRYLLDTYLKKLESYLKVCGCFNNHQQSLNKATYAVKDKSVTDIIFTAMSCGNKTLTIVVISSVIFATKFTGIIHSP